MIETAHIIETPHLKLREMGPALHQYLFKNLNREELKVFFGHDTEAAIDKEIQMYEEKLTAFNKSFCLFHLIEKSSNQTIGWCGYHHIATRHNRGEIGYVINQQKNWGKGYMKEALYEVLKYGFETLKLHRIEALTAKNNFVSQKLLIQRGFSYEGLLAEHYYINGVYEDSLMFSLLERNLIHP